GNDGWGARASVAGDLNLPQPAGVLVQRVAERSIAERCGIRPGTLRATIEGEEIILGGDIILGVNGADVAMGESFDEIYGNFAKAKPGENVVITIFRQGKIVKIAFPPSQ